MAEAELPETRDLAGTLVATLTGRSETLATAESLTGGLLAGFITGVPGASVVYRGGVVSYATDVKHELLGVTKELVTEYGVVSEECAAAMAGGIRDLLHATYGVSTTGVAGPEEQEGQPVGTVYVGVAGPAGTHSVRLGLAGTRAVIREATCAAALADLLSALG